jgi:pimeloyl-ACP methyl ester carboxylesterase
VLTPEHAGGTGEPLVLLHGLAGAWRIWEPVLRELERHFHVVVPSLAGHAGAEPLAEGVTASVSALTDVIEARFDELGIGQAHLAGNSLGGWVALELARRGRARSVVALSPAGAWDPARGVASLVRRAVIARRVASRLRVAEWRLLRRPRGRTLLLGLAMRHPERMSPVAAAAMLDDSGGCAIFDDLAIALSRDGPIAGPVQPRDCPIRIAWGSEDHVIPFEPYGRLMLDAVPGAELVMLPGVGHVPMYDDPALVARTIIEGSRAA